MTAKSFFKSVWFKCIAVLLSIVLVCGILLTICNALFYVSDDERLSRAISKLYGGEEVTYVSHEVDNGVSVTAATVESVYEITSANYAGDYLLSVTGEGGYSGGTVTCWVIVTVAETEGSLEVSGIRSATIASNSGQSYISRISASDIQTMIDGQSDESFTSYSTNGIKTGATFSMGAIANALNGARSYVNEKYCGVVSPFAGYEYNAYIDDATTVSVNGSTVTYNVVTAALSPAGAFYLTVVVGSDGKISSFTIAENGSTNDSYANKMLDVQTLVGKGLSEIESLLSPMLSDGGYNSSNEKQDNTINTGATRSNFLCLYAGAFAVANYDKAIEDFAQGGNS